MAELRFLPDFDALIAPLPGDSPGGDKQVFRDLRVQVDELRREEDPSQYADDDKARPTEYKPADWAGVLRLCLPALQDQAKDLQIARWVVDALPRREESERSKTRWAPGRPAPTAFAALADGLTLLRHLTEDGWEYVLPPHDPDEPDGRNGSFDWLGDDNQGAMLPQLVRTLPLAVTGAGPLTQAAYADPKGDRALFEQIEAAAEREHVEAVLADIDRGIGELAGLGSFLDRTLGGAAPGLSGLKKALLDCQSLCRVVIKRKSGDAPPADDPDGGVDTPHTPAVGGRSAGPPVSRDAAYQQLRQAAELLRRLEPHSPVPYLVLRACELGAKPFPDMIRSFVRDESILAELRRELAIPDDPPAE